MSGCFICMIIYRCYSVACFDFIGDGAPMSSHRINRSRRVTINVAPRSCASGSRRISSMIYFSLCNFIWQTLKSRVASRSNAQMDCWPISVGVKSTTDSVARFVTRPVASSTGGGGGAFFSFLPSRMVDHSDSGLPRRRASRASASRSSERFWRCISRALKSNRIAPSMPPFCPISLALRSTKVTLLWCVTQSTSTSSMDRKQYSHLQLRRMR